MALWKITVKRRVNKVGLRLEEGMSVELVSWLSRNTSLKSDNCLRTSMASIRNIMSIPAIWKAKNYEIVLKRICQ